MVVDQELVVSSVVVDVVVVCSVVVVSGPGFERVM